MQGCIEFRSHLSRISSAGSNNEDSLPVERACAAIEGMTISFEIQKGEYEGTNIDPDDLSEQVTIHSDDQSDDPSSSSDDAIVVQGRSYWPWFWKQEIYLSHRDDPQTKCRSIFAGMLQV
eukprot:CAMPEP_0194214850 /NCGR_PEP_ID=MMETSP0156-20130528/16240_1 /TAXON_ID=33649 /ORGANISM="Thalassionema nitzschioides, Strain L26-B" /LENGTH=119 /DNA_ID=CAMNT_0038943197 /DNA_START=277 /DNA_END=636 /DNA_ORIENTATION=+